MMRTTLLFNIHFFAPSLEMFWKSILRTLMNLRILLSTCQSNNLNLECIHIIQKIWNMISILFERQMHEPELSHWESFGDHIHTKKMFHDKIICMTMFLWRKKKVLTKIQIRKKFFFRNDFLYSTNIFLSFNNLLFFLSKAFICWQFRGNLKFSL